MNRNILRAVTLMRNFKNVPQTVQITKRNAGHGVWTYRAPPPLASKKAYLLAEVLGGLCWFWILYHIATEPEHIYGEWPFENPNTWSNEDLGIPADSDDSVKKC